MKLYRPIAVFVQSLAVLSALAVCLQPTRLQAGYLVSWGDNSNGQLEGPPLSSQFKAVAAGWRDSFALRADGTVLGWGDHGLGTNVPGDLAGVTAIAAGADFRLALKANGTVTYWGVYHTNHVLAGLSNVIAMAASVTHWALLRDDGQVTLGPVDGLTMADTNPPANARQLTAVSAGSGFTMGLRADGTVVAWGVTNANQAAVPAGLSNVIAIAAGNSHGLALKADGTVVGWGNPLSGVANIPPDLSHVVAIAAGLNYSLALRSDGTLVSWGSNHLGVLNVPPLTRVVSLSAGANHALVLTHEGPVLIERDPADQAVVEGSNAVFTVGVNGRSPLSYQWYFNGLGDAFQIPGATDATLEILNVQSNHAGPYRVAVSNVFGRYFSGPGYLTVLVPPRITSFTPSRTIGAGQPASFTVSLKGTTPFFYRWRWYGTNLPGQYSPSLVISNAQPENSGPYSVLVSNLYGVVTSADSVLTVTNTAPSFDTTDTMTNRLVPIGGQAVFNVLAHGSLPLTYQWRKDGVDIPGATTPILELSPATFDQTGYYSVEVRNAFGALLSKKAFLNVVQVYVWGENLIGPVGSAVPTNIPFDLTNAVALAAGNYHILALRSNGRVATWGSIVGTAATNPPASATNVMAIAAGGDSSMALRSNGTVLVWGDNTFGQTNVPVMVSNIVAIASGSTHCVVLRSNGTVLAWGNNAYGQTSVPVGLSNVVGIAAGSLFSVALKADGSLIGWGSLPQGPLLKITDGISTEGALTYSLTLRANGLVTNWGTTPVSSAVSNVVAVSAGNRHLALKGDGKIVAWQYSQALQVPALSNVIAVAAGERGAFSAAALGTGAPFITLHPANQITARSNTLQINARAVGKSPISYQWRLDGRDLPGATTPSLVISNVDGRNSGDYQMVASNALGTAISRVGTITLPFNTNLIVALNATNLNWETYNSTNKSPSWFAQNKITHDGDTAAQSGPITHSQSSYLVTSVTGPGKLKFWWKSSSEEGFDILSLRLDSETTAVRSISGETDWAQETVDIPAGLHQVRWVYSKDTTVSAGRDCGWLDEVSYVPDYIIIVGQPVAMVANAGESVTFSAQGTSSLPFQYHWFKDGAMISGATASRLNLTGVNRRSAGNYSVQASNQMGILTSSNLNLRVVVPQQFTGLEQSTEGTWSFWSRDADGGSMRPEDLPHFDVLVSSNLHDWAVWEGGLTLTNGSICLTDTNSPSRGSRFYRLREK